MAWIEAKRCKDGAVSYWVRDRRNGRAVVIPAGTTRAEAELKKRQYEVRRDLEKEGYEDEFELKGTSNGMD
jgi:hypothetical protein